MVDAIREALSFIEGRTRRELDSNRMLVLALLKELELIGEAASRLSLEYREKNPEVPWALLIATRNRLVHGYFDINLDIVWATVDRDLRELLVVVERLTESDS
jgi:uncharacterized protein with HEPN domain